jgi:hypothetical protein
MVPQSRENAFVAMRHGRAIGERQIVIAATMQGPSSGQSAPLPGLQQCLCDDLPATVMNGGNPAVRRRG